MKIQIRSNVINGKLNRNRNLLIDAIQSFEGKEISITIEKAKKQRSNQQNRYMWSVIIPIVKNCLKSAGNVFSDEQTHELLKYKFLKETILIKEDTGEFVERIKSSTELSTSQMMDYFASIREWVFDFWGVEIPEPNQEIFLNFDE
jgi:hypothetical protein